MSATVISGKLTAERIKNEVKQEATLFEKEHNRKVGLAVIKAGDDPASAVYVRNKINACEYCNVQSFAFFLPHSVAESDLIELIGELNKDERIDGILVQLPLPETINEERVLKEIIPEKDADGFCVENAGKLFLGQKGTVACTPGGIMELIAETGVDLTGKHAVVIGRSNIVGKPVAMLLLGKNATVTMCHSKTANLATYTKTADVLVVAVGRKGIVNGDMIKEGAIVIDVGMNRDNKGLCGDVDFESCAKVAGYITPVPGGVGPMTVAMLLKNTVAAAKTHV